jgi:pyridoxine/pyridoxamine 5'-phosphate oxidase
MMNDAIQKRLQDSKNIWLASARTDGRPHLVPVWFAWHASKLYLCIEPESVKGRNIARNHNVALALEDGSHPVICEGTVTPVEPPWSQEITQIFYEKYEWDITTEEQYTQLLEVQPVKWLSW